MSKAPIKHIEEFETNQRWFWQHLDKILRRHRNKFVAVWHSSVVASDKDLISLSEEVRRQLKGAKGVYIRYATDKPPELIL